jgi:hypothetical protein
MTAAEDNAKEIYKEFMKILEIKDMRSGINPFAKACALYAIEVALHAIGACSVVEGYPRREYEATKEAIESL